MEDGNEKDSEKSKSHKIYRSRPILSLVGSSKNHDRRGWDLINRVPRHSVDDGSGQIKDNNGIGDSENPFRKKDHSSKIGGGGGGGGNEQLIPKASNKKNGRVRTSFLEQFFKNKQQLELSNDVQEKQHSEENLALAQHSYNEERSSSSNETSSSRLIDVEHNTNSVVGSERMGQNELDQSHSNNDSVPYEAIVLDSNERGDIGTSPISRLNSGSSVKHDSEISESSKSNENEISESSMSNQNEMSSESSLISEAESRSTRPFSYWCFASIVLVGVVIVATGAVYYERNLRTNLSVYDDPSSPLFPSTAPSSKPSPQSSSSPTVSSEPTEIHSNNPSGPVPSLAPTSKPTLLATVPPTKRPTSSPSTKPSVHISLTPTNEPSFHPTVVPSEHPAIAPSLQPSLYPSTTPTNTPSSNPSDVSSSSPSITPTQIPSIYPTILPSENPTSHPTMISSNSPSADPTIFLSNKPSSTPSNNPTEQPSKEPSGSPSTLPSLTPSNAPSISSEPSRVPSFTPTIYDCSSYSARMKDISNITSAISGTISSGSAQEKAVDWLTTADVGTNACVDTTSITERYILAVLYYSTSGDFSWFFGGNWLSPNNHCTLWYGISCNSQGEVKQVSVMYNNLTGTIPEELSALTSLEVLRFDSNNLAGTIPTALWSLPNLDLIDVESNSLTGKSFVPELFECKQLTKLRLSNNLFQPETIPTEIGTMTNLEEIWLINQGLVGSISPNLSSLTKLNSLKLGKNDLNGTTPNYLFQMPLEELQLEENSFTGSIPSSMNTTLKTIDLSSNFLTGTIPKEFGAATGLQIFRANDNYFTGSIPNEIGNLSELLYFEIEGNQISGMLPEFSTIRTVLFNAARNQLSGSLPDSLFELPYITFLQLDDNLLSGTIPATYLNASNLIEFHIQNNTLSGTIPNNTATQLPKLESLKFEANNLSGSVPDGLCGLKNTGKLDFISADCVSEILCEEDCCDLCF